MSPAGNIYSKNSKTLQPRAWLATHRSPLPQQRGVSMMAVVFMLVAVSVLGLSIQRMSATHHIGSLYTMRSAQAYFSARGGIEQALGGIAAAVEASADPLPVCDAFNTASPVSIGGFDVTVGCAYSTVEYNEGGPSYRIYSLTAIASGGTFQIPDVANRRIDVQVKFP